MAEARGTETVDPAALLRDLVRLAARAGQRAAALSVAAALVWPLQAAILAWSLAELLHGRVPAPVTAAGGFVALGLLRAGLSFRAEALAFAAGEMVVRHARETLVARAARYGGAPGAGALAALAGEKLDLLLPWVARYGPARARVMAVPPVLLALAFWQSWAVGLVLLVSGPLIPVFMALVGLAAREASRRQMAEIGGLNDLLAERLSALTDIRLLDAGARVVEGFRAASEALRAQSMAVLRVAFLSSAVLELFAALGVAMVAVWCGFSLLGAIGWGGWSGPVSAFAAIWLLLLAPEFYQPLRDLAAAWHDRTAAEAVALELAEAAVGGAPMLGAGGRPAPLPGPPAIRWRGLEAEAGGRRIRYPDAEIRPGETVALTGPSGSGKTTLLRLIAGLSSPEAGQVEVAGQPLDEASADAWRARLGWMPQAPHFLHESLRATITGQCGGDPDVALRRAAVRPVVDALPRGLDTRLGETGAGLSGGEARRIMLARAIHARPDVLLADEPTADLDAETAEAVTEGMLALAQEGVTLVVATHDPALAARLSRVIRLGDAP